jgi:hypothetical protein
MSYPPRVPGEPRAGRPVGGSSGRQARRQAEPAVDVVDADARVVGVDAGVVSVRAVVVVDAGADVVDVEAELVVVCCTPVWGMGPSSSSPQAPSASTATAAATSTAPRARRRLVTALQDGGRAAQVTKPRPIVEPP